MNEFLSVGGSNMKEGAESGWFGDDGMLSDVMTRK